MSIFRTVVCTGSLVALPMLLCAAEPAAAPSQETVSKWFGEQEKLVRSMECQFEKRRLPTDPDMIPLIQEICRQRGIEKFHERYIVSEKSADVQSYRVRFWRKGRLQREEFLPLGEQADQPTAVRAFDGEAVRDLSISKERAVAVIGLPETEHWYDTNWPHPFSFLYEFLHRPYSDLVAKGHEFHAELVDHAGMVCTKVTFRHPDKNVWFVLFVDEKQRLVERQLLLNWRDPKPRIWERYEFADYRAYRDREGRLIWFPQRAVYHYYMGQLPDGRLAEWAREVMTIEKIEFNGNYPDEHFAFDFPEGAHVRDKLTPALLKKSGVLTIGLDSPREFAIGENADVYAFVGGRNPATGDLVKLDHEGFVPPDVHPVVEIEFPNKDPDGKPILVKAALNQRC